MSHSQPSPSVTSLRVLEKMSVFFSIRTNSGISSGSSSRMIPNGPMANVIATGRAQWRASLRGPITLPSLPTPLLPAATLPMELPIPAEEVAALALALLPTALPTLAPAVRAAS